MHRLSSVGILSLLGSTAACGQAREPVVPLDRHLEANPKDATRPWAKLAIGARVSVVPSEACVEEVVSDAGSTSGKPLVPASWSAKSTAFTVIEAHVVGGAEGHLALTMRGDEGELAVVRIPAGREPTCVAPLGAGSRGSIASMLRKPLRFRPTLPTCRTIEAKGSSLGAVLLADDADPVVFNTLVAAPASAGAATGPQASWAQMDGGDLRVRSDVVAACFEPDDPGATLAAKAEDGVKETGRARFALSAGAHRSVRSAVDLLHVRADRCRSSTTPAGEHLECATPVGVWTGVQKPDALSLKLVRRNVGTLHFLDGVAVDGRSFARTVVGVRAAGAADPAVDALNRGLRSETARVLGSDDTLRVAASEAEKPNLLFGVEVTNVAVSEVATRIETVPHQYEDGKKTEPNPEKERAKEAVRTAREGIATAKQECQQKRDDAKDKYDNCMQMAKSTANLANGRTERTLQASGELACAVWRTTMNTNCSSEISAAQSKYDEAVEHERETPATIQVPIIKHTTYPKKIFSRTVTAHVRVASSLDGADMPPLTRPFTTTLTDSEVEPNAAPHVSGQKATAAWLADPSAAVPSVAAPMASWAASHVRGIVAKASLARAKAMLRASGVEAAPGTEDVHALALDVAGDRIYDVLHVGTITGSPGNVVQLPKQARLGAKDCLLAVAALPEGATGKIQIATRDGSVADLRGKPFAAIEVCPGDVAGEAGVPPLDVKTDTAAPIRWAAYRTRGSLGSETTTSAATLAAPPPAAEAEAVDASDVSPRPAPSEALTAYARPGFATWLAGSAGDDALSDVFAAGPSLGVAVGARVGSGWLAYGEWERSFLGVGPASPLASTSGATATGDAFLLGGRKTFTGWAASMPAFGMTQLAPFVDFAVGYSVLRQEATERNVTTTVRLPSATARLLFGLSVRPRRWLSIDPAAGLVGGWVNQIEIEQDNGAGQQRAGTGQFRDGSARATVYGGLAITIDLPFGDGKRPPPAPKSASR